MPGFYHRCGVSHGADFCVIRTPHRQCGGDGMDKTDQQLLQAFVERRDQDAFAAIVERHAEMVYSAALRQAGSAAAEDVTQAVFIVLARKARKIDGATLAGWLINAARLISKDAQRREWRHRKREKKAASMKKVVDEKHPNEANWSDVSPLLDGALGR